MLLELFWTYIKIGFLSLGGGHAAIALIKDIIVEKNGWLTLEEFTNVITISELTPGPFAINSATFIGNKIAGFWGGVVTTIGFMLPSLLIVIILAIIYKKYKKLKGLSGALLGVKPTATGLIFAAVCGVLLLTLFETTSITAIKSIDLTAVGIMIFSLLLLKFTKLNSALVILISGAVGIIVYGFIF